VSGFVPTDPASNFAGGGFGPFDPAAGGTGGSGFRPFDPNASSDVSPEVQLVFDRMSALTGTERNAIEGFVDGMVVEGFWGDVFEFYAPCLNGTDFLTGFKTDTLLNSAQPGTHTAGEYIDFTANAQHLLEGRNFETYSTTDIFIGCYNAFTAVDTGTNADLFGMTDGTRELLMRWRGGNGDFNELIGQTNAGTRSVANVRPTGDFVGLGRFATNQTVNLQPNAVTNLAVQTFISMPVGFPVQWHGQMQSGTPASGNVQNARYSCMISMTTPVIADLEKLRALVLEFLTDIGVSGVPVP